MQWVSPLANVLIIIAYLSLGGKISVINETYILTVKYKYNEWYLHVDWYNYCVLVIWK